MRRPARVAAGLTDWAGWAPLGRFVALPGEPGEAASPKGERRTSRRASPPWVQRR